MARQAAVRIFLRLLELVFLYWISATGRWVLGLALGRRLTLPRTGLVTDDTMPTESGLRPNLYGLTRWLAYDTVYFVVGLITWFVVSMATLLLFAQLFGPLPPVHEWVR
jgi:hypothetical protein